MLSVIRSLKSHKLPKLWERLREIIVFFFSCHCGCLDVLERLLCFVTASQRGVGEPEESSDCSPSSTFFKHILPFVTNSCVFLIITATYSFCSFPKMVSKNFIHFIYRALPVNFTQACAHNELAWPFTETGWLVLDKAFSLHLSTLVLLLVSAHTKKGDKVCCLSSIASCLQLFRKGWVLSTPLTTVSSASRTVSGT